MQLILILLAGAALNRARGDDRWMPPWLPGRALWYVAPLYGALALAAGAHWLDAVFVAVWYLAWATPPWGRLMHLGRPDNFPERLSTFEAELLRIAGGNVHVAFLLRHASALPIAVFIVAAYELAWRVRPAQPIIIAELITGALWGALILGLV